MAAIKRSQANQRRQPESFHFYQQMQLQNPTSALTCIKVELKQFILSILDDPIVSRVFEEAGFRGSDIKFSIIHPPPVSRFSRSIAAPLRFNFPFRDDENFNRIGEILARKTLKNPILIGICADDALNSFSESINRGKTTDLPAEIEGLRVISISSEIREFVGNGGSKEKMDLKMKEISEKMDSCSGVAVNYGEIKVFVNGGFADYVVTSLSRLMSLNGGKLWLIGTASSDETYKMFLVRFPSIEKDWDLCVLPISSSTKSSFGGGSLSKSSLMGSFVPFGGFFPTPSELQNPVSGTSKSVDTRCEQCDAKYNQEASLLISGKPSVSVTDSNRSTNLPFWLQKEDSLTTKISKTIEASDGGTVLNARLKGLQRKWNDICGRLHQNHPLLNTGPHFLQSGLEKAKEKDSDSASLLHQTRSPNSCITSVTTDLGLGTISPPIQENPRRPGFLENPRKPGFQENPREPEFQDEQRNCAVQENPRRPNFLKCRQNIPVPVILDRVNNVASDWVAGEKDYKYLYRVLAEKVGWQDEAISAISETLTRCRSGERRRRGDIWIGFLGPDKIGKRLIAEELSRIMFGSRENFIMADLSSDEERRGDSNSAFYCQGLCGSGVSYRGKTVVDYIADELRNKPNSVVFLENVDKADFVAQSCLSLAIKTGKFQDSHMREVSMKNTIFVITSSESKIDNILKSGKILPEYTEERILEAKCMEMQIVVECFNGGNLVKNSSSNVFIKPRKKRKLTETYHSDEKEISQDKPKRICLDLNLPVEEDDEDSDSSSETRVSFFQDFLEKMDEKVFFNPVHFDSRAEEILKRINLCLKNKLGFNAFLEIDDDPLVQILAADWLSGCKNGVENWVESVLYKAFVEANETHNLESKFIMKLVSDSDAIGDSESRVSVCLPAKVIVK
jgi:hypothetical protein